MQSTKYTKLVEDAFKARQGRSSERIAALRSRVPQLYDRDEVRRLQESYAPWVQELKAVNDHITVGRDVIDEAAKIYKGAGTHLVAQLEWAPEDIRVFPQGSAATRTLIRTVNNAAFDIDAVCAVDLSLIDTRDPIGFFEKIGKALAQFDPMAKNRCWRLPCTGQPFYIEFTPSVPLEAVSLEGRERMGLRFPVPDEYKRTALAVVDRRKEQWKSSNPEGLARWVSDASKLVLVRRSAVREEAAASANVGAVPPQEIEVTEVLPLAIRLCKRHRDMSVRRNYITEEHKPISVVLTTLLTMCYMGLAVRVQQRPYDHALALLADLIELLPHMIERRGNDYWVANPTVIGENFAERWNEDDGERYEAFLNWCSLLSEELDVILEKSDPREIRQEVRRVFGCPEDAAPKGNGNGNGGLRRIIAPPPAPATRGLA